MNNKKLKKKCKKQKKWITSLEHTERYHQNCSATYHNAFIDIEQIIARDDTNTNKISVIIRKVMMTHTEVSKIQ